MANFPNDPHYNAVCLYRILERCGGCGVIGGANADLVFDAMFATGMSPLVRVG